MVTRPLEKAAHLYSVYFAPRGRDRLLRLGEQISLRHLSYLDKLIGIVGDSGSGKSSIISGMFPGLELANHDDGLNPMRIMEIQNNLDLSQDCMTYHIDMRFQLAFTQMFTIVEFVKKALTLGKRVIVEHFDLLYPHLKINAEILIGIGEEVLITRPTVLGPLPKDLVDIVYMSLKFRKIAHSAEDITSVILEREFKVEHRWTNSDVRRGFVLEFADKQEIDFDKLEERVLQEIRKNLSISYHDESNIIIEGFGVVSCSGPRIHVNNTSEIEYFKLIKELVYDTFYNRYLLVGLVDDISDDISGLNKLHFY